MHAAIWRVTSLKRLLNVVLVILLDRFHVWGHFPLIPMLYDGQGWVWLGAENAEEGAA